TSFLCHVGETPLARYRFCAMSGETPLARHRFCAMSGEHLWPDVVFAPCRGNTSGPTSFLRHVGEPLLVPLFPGEGTSPAPPQYPDTKTPAGRMTGGCL